MSKKMNSNYLWRVYFTFLIVLSHGGMYGFFYNPNESFYIGVDYFFIISGLMLAMGVYSRKYNDTSVEYIVGRIKKFYPHIILSFLIFFLYMYRGCTIKEFLAGMVGYMYQIIPFMWHILPHKDYMGPMNFPVWYISVLLWCSVIVFYMITRHRDLFVNFFAPLICFGGYYYLVNACDSFNSGNIIFSCISVQYLRGLSDLCLGCMLFLLIRKIEGGVYRDLHLE